MTRRRKAIMKILDICDKYNITPNEIDNAMIGDFEDTE